MTEILTQAEQYLKEDEAARKTLFALTTKPWMLEQASTEPDYTFYANLEDGTRIPITITAVDGVFTPFQKSPWLAGPKKH